jgi:diadenosine tetraphosphate (Ap4A) HIT family hydrolase
MDVINYTLYTNSHFVVEQCRSCPLPGYLIASPVHEAAQLDELPPAAASLLGPTLVRVVAAVKQVLQPVRIYCAQFGEEQHQLHFHIFPRTTEITQAYLKHKPEQRELIHGPVLFDWARDKYKDLPVSQQTQDVMEKIRYLLSNAG